MVSFVLLTTDRLLLRAQHSRAGPTKCKSEFRLQNDKEFKQDYKEYPKMFKLSLSDMYNPPHKATVYNIR